MSFWRKLAALTTALVSAALRCIYRKQRGSGQQNVFVSRLGKPERSFAPVQSLKYRLALIDLFMPPPLYRLKHTSW